MSGGTCGPASRLLDCAISIPTCPIATPGQSLPPCFYQRPNLGGLWLWETDITFEGQGSAFPHLPFGSLSILYPALPQAEPRDSGGSCRSPQLTTHAQKERQEQEPVGRSKDPHDTGDAAGRQSPGAGGMWCSVQPSEGGSLRWAVAEGRRGQYRRRDGDR